MGVKRPSLPIQVIHKTLVQKLQKEQLIWQIDVDEDGKGKLYENSASGTTIGRLNATDDNPDDEVIL